MRTGILREHAVMLDTVMRVLDLAAVLFSGWFVYYLHFDLVRLEGAYLSSIIVTALFTILIFNQFNLYRGWRGASVINEIQLLVVAWGMVFLILLPVSLFSNTLSQFSTEWLWQWFAFGVTLLVSIRLALRELLKWLRSLGLNYRTVIIIGSGDLANYVIHQLKDSPWVGIRVMACFDDKEDGGTGKWECENMRVGTLADAAEFVEQEKIDQVWITLPLKAEDKLRKVLHDLRHSTADIRMVPDIFSYQLLQSTMSDVAGIPVINLASSPMVGSNRVIKAIEDKIVALIILILISPLLLILAIGVKISSPGPVLFKQMRHGWDGKPILVYKFRSMKIHQEAVGQVTQAMKSDPRITPFGSFMRRTSLDELPQFINVLQGRMSIVGPRPHAIEHNEHYKTQVDRYMLRHKVKPGITGWAQINGYRGETDTLFKMQKRVEYDLYYIENWSVWLDIKIIFLTAFKGFVDKNAY